MAFTRILNRCCLGKRLDNTNPGPPVSSPWQAKWHRVTGVPMHRIEFLPRRTGPGLFFPTSSGLSRIRPSYQVIASAPLLRLAIKLELKKDKGPITSPKPLSPPPQLVTARRRRKGKKAN